MKDDHKRRCLSSLDMHLTPPLFRASFDFELRCNLLTLAKTQWGEIIFEGVLYLHSDYCQTGCLLFNLKVDIV